VSSTGDSTLAERLARRAVATPGKVALRCDEDVLTYGELDERVQRAARSFAALGVAAGDAVCVLLDTSVDYVTTWLALCRIGAVEVAINTGFRGLALEHALRLTAARYLVLDADFASPVGEALRSAPALRHVVLRGDPKAADRLRDVVVTPFEQLFSAHAEGAPARGEPGATTMLVFTSGSTGPSKACALPHRYTLRQPEIFCEQLGVGADDVLYAPFPLFHVDGAIFTVAAAFACGGAAALARRFSVSRFWSDCRRHQATVFDFMGATLSLLHKQPPSPADRDHCVRLGWGVPAPPFADEFERRFGVQLVEVYGLSDVGIVLYNRPGEPRRAGSCGRPVEAFDLRIADESGRELAEDETGELLVRANEPHLIMNGYYGDASATAAAFRDGWFRTGDLMRRDADGFHHFVGRLKDLIRRRGENISAFDLEQALLSHPDVLEAAAYGVPSELTEEDVMVTIVPRPGSALDADGIFEWARTRLARHMWPRYIDLADSLPRTPTEKIAKHLLKQRGVTPGSVDFDMRARRSASGDERT
jgi:crotonobetaine/carnitine-CoA ligase